MARLSASVSTTSRNVNTLWGYISVTEYAHVLTVTDPGATWLRWGPDKGAATVDWHLDGKLTNDHQRLTVARQATLIAGTSAVGSDAADYVASIAHDHWYFSTLPSSAGDIPFYLTVVSFSGTVGLWLRNGTTGDAYSAGVQTTLGIETPIPTTYTAYRDSVLCCVVNGGPVGYTKLRPNALYANGLHGASLPNWGSDGQRCAMPLTPITPDLGAGFVTTSTRIHARTIGTSVNEYLGTAQGACTLSPHAEFPATFDIVASCSTWLEGVRFYASVTVYFEGGTTTGYRVLLADLPQPSPGSPLELFTTQAIALVDYPGAILYFIVMTADEYITSPPSTSGAVLDYDFIWATKGTLPVPTAPQIYPAAGTGPIATGLGPGQAL